MKKQIKQIIAQTGSGVIDIAVKVATLNANTTCTYIAHQPKLPASVKKLRKF